MSAPLLLSGICLLICAGCTAGEVDTQSSSQKQPVHPSFDLSLQELEERIAAEPAGISARISERPEYFLQLMTEALQLEEWALALVDKEHGLPEGYRPDDLIYLKDYPLTLNRDSLQLSRVCMPDLLAMTEAARSDGVELVYSSTYRSYEYQKDLYENYVANYGQEEADRFSARPGTSQHQLGTTIDFGSITPEFGATDQGRWLKQHAWEYGFSLSYPEGMEELTGYMFEIWHYRYITRTGTRIERDFFGGIQQYLTEFMARHGSFFSEHLVPAS